jgi:molecular chaperone GrpE
MAPAGAAPPVSAPPPGSPAEQRARLAEDRLAEVLAAYRTLKNENEDYRDRQSRNLERRYEQRRERLLLKFIDVLDNLDRALEAAQTSYAGQPLLEGMILVRTQLLQTLQDEGLERIPVLGLPFDPAVSESVGTEPVKEAEQDHMVVKELLRGYRLNGRIARPSRVVIGAFGGAQPEAPAPGGVVPAIAPAPGPAANPSTADTHRIPGAPAPPAAAPAPSAAPPAKSAEDSRSTAETAKLPAPPMPPPVPPKPGPPRRKGR